VDVQFASLKQQAGGVTTIRDLPLPVRSQWHVSHNAWADASRLTVTAFIGEEGLDIEKLHLSYEGRQAMLPLPASPRVGDEAPPVIANTSSGDAILPEKQTGRHTLVVFWSPSDKKLDRLFDDLQALRREFGDTNRFRMITVCLDSSEEGWERWLGALKDKETTSRDGKHHRLIDDPVWWSAFQTSVKEPSSERYGVQATPESFLIAPSGRLSAVHISLAELKKTVAESFASSPGAAAAGSTSNPSRADD
jgi:hypothetical protein